MKFIKILFVVCLFPLGVYYLSIFDSGWIGILIIQGNLIYELALKNDYV